MSDFGRADLWNTVAPDFAPDGALRDIYIENATTPDWQSMLRNVDRWYGPLAFSVDGDSAPMPDDVRDVFAARDQHGVLLNFSVGGIDIACHFFAEDEIEFDLVPNQVDGPERLAAVVEFLRRLAALLDKPVILTAENTKSGVILRARPDGNVEHVAPQYP